MKMSRHERRTLIIGACVAGLTIVITWVLVPLGRAWCEQGRQLEPKLAELAVLRARAREQEALLARRARFVRQLGSLIGSAEAAVTKPQKKGEPPREGEEPASGSSKGSPSPQPSDAGAQSVPAGRSIEAELEKTLKQSGVKIKRVSPESAARASESLKHFEMIGLKIELDANIESLVKALHALEKGPRLIRVTRLKVHQDLDKPGALSVTIGIVAYEADQRG